MKNIETFNSVDDESKPPIINRRDFLKKTGVYVAGIATGVMAKNLSEKLKLPDSNNFFNRIETPIVKETEIAPGIIVEPLGIGLKVKVGPNSLQEGYKLRFNYLSDYQSDDDIVVTSASEEKSYNLHWNNLVSFQGDSRHNSKLNVTLIAPDGSQSGLEYNISLEPFLFQSDNIVIASDKPKNLNQGNVHGILVSAHNQIDRFNTIIQRESHYKDSHVVSGLAIYEPVAKQEMKGLVSRLDQRKIIAGTNLLENKEWFLTGLAHESGHFVYAALAQPKQDAIEQAYKHLIKMAGFNPNQDYTRNQLGGNKHDFESSKFIQLFDESHVLEEKIPLDEKYGHPYDMPTELFASFTALAHRHPDKIIQRFGKFSSEQQQDLKENVILPILSVYSPQSQTVLFNRLLELLSLK